jgi:hypothetical protein
MKCPNKEWKKPFAQEKMTQFCLLFWLSVLHLCPLRHIAHTMKVGIIGGGPSGITALLRLSQSSAFKEGKISELILFEANDFVGGRTHTHEFSPHHFVDTGAGYSFFLCMFRVCLFNVVFVGNRWLGSFYSHTLQLFKELGFSDVVLRGRTIRGASDVVVEGKTRSLPLGVDDVLKTDLLNDEEKKSYAQYLKSLQSVQGTYTYTLSQLASLNATNPTKKKERFCRPNSNTTIEMPKRNC